MKILVTGGAGFIGSCFIRQILNKYPGYNIINLDALTYAGNIRNLNDISENPNYTFVKGNICDKELVENLTEKADCVINFAAESHVDRSIASPDMFVETNIKGTLTLLEACKKSKIEKYLQISTDEVYGSLGKTGYFSEQSPLLPNSPYSASKASADMLVRAYYKTYGLGTIITRCSNNYGPYQYPEKLIPFFINKLLKEEKVPLYGDGQNVRDWIYVYDHCSAIDAVLHKGPAGEIYNIGGNCEKTNLEITRTILKALGKNETCIEFVKDRLGHDKRYAIDSSKIKRELGWQPSMNFENGIEQTIAWYLRHQEFIKLIEKKQKIQ